MKKPTAQHRNISKNFDLMRFRTYAGLKKWANSPSARLTVEQRFAVMERMRQLRYGYKPGELKMDKTAIRQYDSMEEFRKVTDQEYEEEIKKYGPR